MDQQRRSRLWPTREQILVAVGIAIVLLILISFGYDSHWTGRSRSKVSGEVEPAKTLWDWLNLLIVPAVLALAGYLFTSSQNRATRNATQERAQDEALQAYLDKMADLLIDKNIREQCDRYDDSRITARAQTLAVLRQLDGERKKIVLLFLREARLINRDDRDDRLRGGRKYYASIVGLRGADLKDADLRDAKLINTDRDEPVSLEGIILRNADLQGADLQGADLSGAWLSHAKLYRANLSEANLSEAHMKGALLRADDKSDAADLSGANLSGADLSDAEITDEQLEQAKFLKGATMPDGQVLKSDDNPEGPTFEEWSKSKDRRKARESSRSS